MRMRNFVMLPVILVMVCCNVRADLIWDSGHREYSDGDEKWVYMYNDASVDVTGGWIGELYMYNETIADFSGGGIGALLCYDTSKLGIYNASTISLLRPSNSSIVNIHGGTINNLIAIGSSNTYIHDGTLNILDAGDTSTVFLYTEYYDFDPDGGLLQSGLLTGVWFESGNTFSIELESKEAFGHIVFIPEPGSVFLFLTGVSMLLLKPRKHKDGKL